MSMDVTQTKYKTMCLESISVIFCIFHFMWYFSIFQERNIKSFAYTKINKNAWLVCWFCCNKYFESHFMNCLSYWDVTYNSKVAILCENQTRVPFSLLQIFIISFIDYIWFRTQLCRISRTDSENVLDQSYRGYSLYKTSCQPIINLVKYTTNKSFYY